MAGRNGWSEYQKLVLSRLDGQDRSLTELGNEVKELRSKDVVDLKVEIAMLKVKAGLWGAAAGAVPGALAVLYVWLDRAPK